MKKLLFLFLLGWGGLTQAQKKADSTAFRPVHEFWVSVNMDCFLNNMIVHKRGIAPAKVFPMPSYRFGVIYNIRPFKKIQGGFSLEAYYSRQYYTSGFSYYLKDFYQDDSYTNSDKIAIKYKTNNDYLSIFLGYEHRINISKKKDIKFSIAGKVGAVFSLGEEHLGQYAFLLSSGLQPVYNLYADRVTSFVKGIDNIPLELSLGFIFRLTKRTRAKIHIAYAQPIYGWTGWSTSIVFYNAKQEEMGGILHSQLQNYLNIGFDVKF